MPIDAGYGDTSSGKSQAIERLAGHIWEHSGKKTRVYYGDGGVATYNSRGLVDDGVIQVMDFSAMDYPDTVIKLLSEGWWFKDPTNPKSKLVAPPANLFDEFGMQVYEGGTVMGHWMLSDVPGGMAWHAAKQTGFGGIKDEGGNLSWKDDFKNAEKLTDDYLLQGFNAPKHYMIIQKKLLGAIRRSKAFPGMTFWTFHPTNAPDKTAGGESGEYGKITGKKIIGPEVGGSALSSLIGREFGNLLHFDMAITMKKQEKDDTTGKLVKEIEREYRLYTRRHFDPNQDVYVEYVAGTRSSAVADFYVSKTPGDSLLQFYEALAQGQRAAKEARTK